MAELDNERAKQGTGILLSFVLIIEEEVSYMS